MLDCIGIWSLSSLCHIIIYALRWRILFVLYMHLRICHWWYILISHLLILYIQFTLSEQCQRITLLFFLLLALHARWAHCPRNHLNYVDFTFALSISLIICTSTWLKFFEGFSQCSVFGVHCTGERVCLSKSKLGLFTAVFFRHKIANQHNRDKIYKENIHSVFGIQLSRVDLNPQKKDRKKMWVYHKECM